MKHALLTFFLLLFFTIPSHASEWVPFKIHHGHVTFDIEFDGTPSTAMLDSGAEVHMVDAVLAEKYGKNLNKAGKMTIIGANSTSEVQVYNNVPIKFFGIDLEFDDVPSGNLGDIGIILGAPFFRNFIIQLDYPKQLMRVLPRGSVDMNKRGNVKMKRQRGSSLAVVKVDVEGEPFWLTFDTGSTGGVYIKRSYAEDHGWLKKADDVSETASIGVNSMINTESFSVDSLGFGPYTLDNIDVQIPADGEVSNVGKRSSDGGMTRISSGKQSKGLLGYDILKHFVVTIDYYGYNLHIYAP